MGPFGKLFGRKSEQQGPAKMKPAATGGATKVKDLVCGMDLDPKTAPAKSEYMGQTYYFCAPGCKKAFDANPAKYIGAQGATGHGGH